MRGSYKVGGMGWDTVARLAEDVLSLISITVNYFRHF